MNVIAECVRQAAVEDARVQAVDGSFRAMLDPRAARIVGPDHLWTTEQIKASLEKTMLGEVLVISGRSPFTGGKLAYPHLVESWAGQIRDGQKHGEAECGRDQDSRQSHQGYPCERC